MRDGLTDSNHKGAQVFLTEMTLQLQTYRSKLPAGLFPARLLVRRRAAALCWVCAPARC